MSYDNGRLMAVDPPDPPPPPARTPMLVCFTIMSERRHAPSDPTLTPDTKHEADMQCGHDERRPRRVAWT